MWSSLRNRTPSAGRSAFSDQYWICGLHSLYLGNFFSRHLLQKRFIFLRPNYTYTGELKKHKNDAEMTHDQLCQSFFKNAITVTGGTAWRQKAAVPYLHGRNNMHREKKKKKAQRKKKFTMKKKRKILKEVKYQNFTCSLKASVIASHIF